MASPADQLLNRAEVQLCNTLFDCVSNTNTVSQPEISILKRVGPLMSFSDLELSGSLVGVKLLELYESK
jgi:hypothetical protein